MAIFSWYLASLAFFAASFFSCFSVFTTGPPGSCAPADVAVFPLLSAMFLDQPNPPRELLHQDTATFLMQPRVASRKLIGPPRGRRD